jgi:hypothetical protein
MKQLLPIAASIFLVGAALFWLSRVHGEQPVAMKIAAPELKDVDEWLNSKPLQLRDLRGKVVALHFWTFG